MREGKRRIKLGIEWGWTQTEVSYRVEATLGVCPTPSTLVVGSDYGSTSLKTPTESSALVGPFSGQKIQSLLFGIGHCAISSSESKGGLN